MSFCSYFFFLMRRRPPRSTRTDTLFLYTTLFRSLVAIAVLTIVAFYFGLDIRTVGDLRELPATLPILALPAVSSDEHTAELQSLIAISYAVFCLQKQSAPPHNTARIRNNQALHPHPAQR